MNTTLLKEVLLRKYTDREEGIELEEFLKNTKTIKNIWQEFHHIVRSNVKYFYKSETIQGLKLVTVCNKIYLFIRLHPWDYLIIDLETKKVVNKIEAQALFSETLFIETFGEEREKEKYLFLNICKNPEKILNFYLENENVLSLPTFFYYSIEEDASTYLYIDFVGKLSHIGFFVNQHGLKEQFFWDSQNNNRALYEKTMNIKIPYDKIPSGILEKDKTRTRKLPR